MNDESLKDRFTLLTNREIREELQRLDELSPAARLLLGEEAKRRGIPIESPQPPAEEPPRFSLPQSAAVAGVVSDTHGLEGTGDAEEAMSSPDEDLPSSTKKAQLLALFVPSKTYVVTPVIVTVNLLLFVLMLLRGANLFLPDNADLLFWGANFRPITLEGEWWRILTNVFVHMGVFHLLLNMYALVSIGILLEPVLGPAMFATAYLVTGVAGSLVSCAVHPVTISAGASGAIFGLYGVFLALLTTDIIGKKRRNALLVSILMFVGYNLLAGMKEGIDNAAHIGGLMSGIVIGFAFLPSLRQAGERTLKIATVSITIAVMLIGAHLVFDLTPDVFGKYDAKIKEFAADEEAALTAYRIRVPSKVVLATNFQLRAVPQWNHAMDALNFADSLDLPEALHQRVAVLKRYVQLRLEVCNLVIRSSQEETEAYDSVIASRQKEIAQIILDLKGGQSRQEGVK